MHRQIPPRENRPERPAPHATPGKTPLQTILRTENRWKIWLSLLSALLLISRWFLLNEPLWYGLVLLAGLAAGHAALAPLKGNARFFWLLPFFLDLAGLALCVFSSASFFLHLHTALCSVTLPLYLGWLSGPSFSSPSTHAKETEPCPPET